MARSYFFHGKPVLQPEGKARRSQVITTYGPGALVDLLDDAVLVSGLDFWGWDATSSEVIDEPRLRDELAPRLKAMGRSLRVDEAFRTPPVGDDQTATKRVGVPVLEFPAWFVCQDPECRALVRADGLELRGDRYFHDCKRTGVECVPVRFVGACKNGHLSEFPWAWFVHQSDPCGAPRLFLEEGTTGDFAQVKVRCRCGKERRLIDAKAPGSGQRCWGSRPWLGPEGDDGGCDEDLSLIVRTASNAYFSQVVSALSIPEPGLELQDRVKSVWDVLQAATKELLPALRAVPKVQAAIKDFGDGDVLEAVAAIKSGKTPKRERLRTAEFQQFLAAKDEATGELPKPEDLFWARRARLDEPLPKGIERVVLAHKLREVRVEIGFTRIEPATPDLQGEYDLGVRSAPLGLQTDWLPAVEVRGEGIFIRLDEAAVQRWEKLGPVEDREKELLAGWSKEHGNLLPTEFPGVRFYLLHSLAHLLITAVSLDCGYAASAIRERIYCESRNDPQPMAAILLSTGSPGTEGTLGGLVEQGHRLREHLRHAWRLGSLCSNDPVCAAHSPHDDLSERHLEGAACHGCLFIAESSCERFNRYLDRALVVPVIGQPEKLAFFEEEP